MARRAQSSIPTVAERINQPSVLNPAVRSYSYSEYDEKRPGYVNPDRSAGSAMGALARSLSGFYSSFNKLAVQQQDKMVEESVAKGETLLKEAQDTEDQLRNMVSWKQFVEKNPEYANENPWVAKGYEKARLKELGIEMTSGLSKFIDEQGLYNNEDPKALQSGVNSYINNFRQQAGLNSYEDKILMTRFFSPLEAQARANVTSTYDSIQRNGRQDKLAEQTSSLIATTIRAMREQGQAVDMGALQKIVQDSLDNGLLGAKADEVMLAGIQTAYLQTKDRSVLETVKYAEVDGHKLIDLPEGAKWYDACIDEINREAKARAAEAKANAKEFREKRVTNLALTLYPALQSGQFKTYDEAFSYVEEQTGKQFSPEERLELTEKINNIFSKYNTASRNEAGLPVNISISESTVANVYGRAATVGEAREAINELAMANPQNKVYKEHLEKLCGPDAEEYFNSRQGVQEDAEKQLRDIATAYVDGLIKETGDTTKNPVNRKILIDSIVSTSLSVFSRRMAEEAGNIPAKDKDGNALSLTPQGRRALMNPVLEEIRNEINVGKYAPKDAGAMLNSGSPNLVPGFFLFKPSDTPEARVAKYDYTVKTEKYLGSNENTTLGKISLLKMSDSVDVEALVATGNITPTAHDIVPFLRQDKGFGNPILSEDGTLLTITVDADTPQAVIDGANADAETLFPQMKNLKVRRLKRPEKKPYATGSWGFLDNQN